MTVRKNDAAHLCLGDCVHLEATPDPLKVFAADGRALSEVATAGEA